MCRSPTIHAGSGSRSAIADDRGVPPAPGHLVHRADRPQRPRDQGVDQCRLADAGMPDEHAAMPGQTSAATRSRSAPGEVTTIGTPSGAYCATSSSGAARSALVRQSSGSIPASKAGDQDAVDHPGPRRRVRQGGDDHQLVGVGDDRPLVRVVVVGRTAQHGAPLLDLDDPGQRALVAGGVADQPHPVADDRPPCGRAGGPWSRVTVRSSTRAVNRPRSTVTTTPSTASA